MIGFKYYVRGTIKGNRRSNGVRTKRTGLVGVFVAEVNPDNQTYRIGWSMCNPKDEFNKETAVDMAMVRMRSTGTADLPHSLVPTHDRVMNRIDRILASRKLMTSKA